MLTVAIAIEIPGDAAHPAPIVSKSCEAVVGDGRCPLAQELGASSVVAWYAIVRADDAAGSRLRIEFHDKSPTGAIVETRDLVFSERDDSESRWSSAGAVIAAFVAARDAPDAPPVPRRPDSAAAGPPRDTSVPWGFDLAFVTGPGLDQGPYRTGVLGRGFVGLPRAPNVFAALSFRYAERPGNLDLSWVSASAGIGARTGGTHAVACVELLGELVVERMFIAGRSPITGHEGSSAENRFGGRLGSNGALAIWNALAIVVGAEVSVTRPSVDITFLDAKAGRTPTVEFATSFGLRYRR
jgi:hypothetical protein